MSHTPRKNNRDTLKNAGQRFAKNSGLKKIRGLGWRDEQTERKPFGVLAFDLSARPLDIEILLLKIQPYLDPLAYKLPK